MRLDRQLFFYQTQGGGKPCPGLWYFAPSGHLPFGTELLCERYGNFRPLKFLKNQNYLLLQPRHDFACFDRFLIVKPKLLLAHQSFQTVNAVVFHWPGQKHRIVFAIDRREAEARGGDCRFVDRVSRLHCCCEGNGSRLSTLAVIVPGPVSILNAWWNSSEVLQISSPEAVIV